MQKPLSDDDKNRLDELNKAVSTAIAMRKEWLDKKMSEYAVMQVGEYIYDLESGEPKGTVSKLYRFWRDRDEGVRDTGLNIEYEFATKPGVFDNTSRQPFRLGSKSQAEARAKQRLNRLSR